MFLSVPTITHCYVFPSLFSFIASFKPILVIGGKQSEERKK